jgi:hypothetical protein
MKVTPQQRAAALAWIEAGSQGMAEWLSQAPEDYAQEYRDADKAVLAIHATIRALLTEQGPEVVTVEELEEVIFDSQPKYKRTMETAGLDEIIAAALAKKFPHGIIVKEKKA